jgi:hypothetical protein
MTAHTLEQIAASGGPAVEKALLSIAASLKRIADAVEEAPEPVAVSVADRVAELFQGTQVKWSAPEDLPSDVLDRILETEHDHVWSEGERSHCVNCSMPKGLYDVLHQVRDAQKAEASVLDQLRAHKWGDHQMFCETCGERRTAGNAMANCTGLSFAERQRREFEAQNSGSMRVGGASHGMPE